MNITKEYLSTRWTTSRMRKIALLGLFIGCDTLLNKKYIDLHWSPLCDVIWTNQHDKITKKRDRCIEAKHIFVSQICDKAVEEFRIVCDILEVKRLIIIGTSNNFLSTSRRRLKKLNIEPTIYWKLDGNVTVGK